MSIQYNILFSTNSIGFPYIKERLKSLVLAEDKVVIFPWAFPVEMSDKEFTEEYFPKYGRRYEDSIGYLREFGIKDEKDIYAISDDGAILVDRKTNKFEVFVNVEKITIN